MTATYLIASSQRSGSTLLAETLKRTGVAGCPDEFFQYLPTTTLPPQPREWFGGSTDVSILDLLPPIDPGRPDMEPAEEWRSRIQREGKTVNGSWGGKLMWNQVDLLLASAKELPDASGRGLTAALHDVLPELTTIIYVHRADIVAQAVSFWRAIQTGMWRSGDSSERDDSVYHRGAIAHLIAALARQRRGWKEWLPTAPFRVVDVPYEQLTRNYSATVARVFSALGITGVDVPPPPLRRQADGKSLEWVSRYRSEARQ